MVVVIVVAAGLFIVGAPAPVLTYVRKERRSARRWLSDAVLRFSAARGVPLRGVQASVGRLSGTRCLACTGRMGRSSPGRAWWVKLGALAIYYVYIYIVRVGGGVVAAGLYHSLSLPFSSPGGRGKEKEGRRKKR